MGTAYKVTNNTHSAEDASQDAFVSAWMNLSALRDGDKFGSWVCAIAKNCARTLVTHYRSTVPDISLDLLLNYDLSDDDSEWDQMCEDYSDLHAAVDALSEKLRQTIKLYYFEEKSITEIAEHLSVPEGTVKWRLSEGRKQLRKGYGIMDKTFNENETLVERVMRQVEALKLWRIKDSKEGFEEEYRAVLSSVEALEDSKEKSYMLADTLKLGYWWVKSENNEETVERIRKAALDGHNDEVMQFVACHDHDKLSGDEKIDFMKDTQIPYYREHNFPKTLAYVMFWLGYQYRQRNELEEAIKWYKEVLTVLSPTDVYYANALAAIDGETRSLTAKKDETVSRRYVTACGETYKKLGRKIYFWEQPGYGGERYEGSLFWNMSNCDGLMLDPDMKVGDKISSNAGCTLTYLRDDGAIDTPAGHFENCSVYIYEGKLSGATYTETWMAENIGIVYQKFTRYGETNEWLLTKYRICGGEGFLPLAAKNRWEYQPKALDTARIDEVENYFEVTASENGTTVVSNMTFQLTRGYFDTWEGNIVKAREQYFKPIDEDNETLVDVSEAMRRTEELAKTKREKLHTKIANGIMKRIFETDNDFNPDYTQKGRWNFFRCCDIIKENGKVSFDDDRKYSFEWKDMSKVDDEGYKVLYTFLLDILQDATGCIWSDKWVDGYGFEERKVGKYKTKNFKVTDGEAVTTPAGTFENCRHIGFYFDSWGYFKGQSDFWFAPGVGIVKFERPYRKTHLALWHLTEYKGTGEGYFPVDDGLSRRYEPDTLGNGWHGSVEFTFDTDENGTVMFKDAVGNQDRENYLNGLEKK